jgi:tRNA (adenine22-N1)-methyltransferase
MVPMNISTRLRQLNKMVTHRYSNIWDCCCDHGLLGMMLLERNTADRIHFVDKEPALMAKLENTLQQFFPPIETASQCQWQTHTMDATALKLGAEHRQLIIISGVGGKLTANLVRNIVNSHANKALEFLVCPVYHHYELRATLHSLGFGLITENLLLDNKRFYEIIHVSSQSSTQISPVGSLMWDFSRINDQRYLQRTLAHYQRKLAGLQNQQERQQTERIIAAYDHLNSTI